MPANSYSSVQEVPAIQDNQFNQQQNGSVRQNVNLFRGDVNFTFPLVEFTGRNGLDLRLGAAYQSNVHPVAARRNLEAPTGVLGLGWMLAHDRIQATYAGANADGTKQYTYVSNGGGNPLIRVDKDWTRGVISEDLIPDLDSAHLSPGLLDAVLGQGISLSATATILVTSAGHGWRVHDPVNETELRLEHLGNAVTIYDGGLAYETLSFDFSRVAYYPAFEKWAITTKEGLTKVFGGGLETDADGFRTSAGNAIQWQVRWGNWRGPSSLTHDENGRRVQQQQPESWDLRAVRNRWNDEITYAYEQTLQPVGAGGLPYTKASYLSKVTGVFGRTATFHYADKVYDSSGSQQPREFADPNKAVPDENPDAYQTRYETKYLEEVRLASPEGTPLFRWRFGYELTQFASIIGGSPPDLFGNTVKRTLTGITKLMPGGQSLPPETYTYYPAGETNAGALATRTYREGAVTSYKYAKQDLVSCARSLEIRSPNGTETPRVWFGEDYAVVLWYDTGGRLYISAYTWIGRWVKWTPKLDSVNTYLQLDTLDVLIAADSFVISYAAANDQDVFLMPFHQDKTILGGWLENTPGTITLSNAAADVSLTGGHHFFAINDLSRNEVTRYTWDDLGKSWKRDVVYPGTGTFGKRRFYLTAANNTLVALDYDILSSPSGKQNTLELFYLDELDNWQRGDSVSAPEINVPQDELTKDFHWTPSPWAFVATYVTERTQSSLNYGLSIYTWSATGDSGYQFQPVTTRHYQQPLTGSGKQVIPYVAQLSSTGLIVSGPNLLRFNGLEWLDNTLPVKTSVNDQNLYWFTQGEDIVLKTENTTNLILSQAQAFDPNTEITSWTAGAIDVNNYPNPDSRLSRYHPTGGRDYVTFNDKIFSRETSNDWVRPLSNPLQLQLPPTANITSLINTAPYYFAFLTESGSTPLGTQLYLIENGVVNVGPLLPEAFFAVIDGQGKVASGTNGKIPSNGRSFVTYAPLTGDFSAATSINLHRYLQGNMGDSISVRSVYEVEINDGFDTTTTNYAFDPTDAAIDAGGSTAKYYRSTTTEGNGTSKKYGWRVYTYYNGIGGSPTVGNPTEPTGFDGLPVGIEDYDAGGKLIRCEATAWEIFTSVLPVSGTSSPTPLHGSFARKVSVTGKLDGVEQKINFGYDMVSGCKNLQSSSRFTAEGKEETRVRHVRFAHEFFPATGYFNLLAGEAQQTRTIQLEGQPVVVQSAKATTWRGFDGTDGSGATPRSIPATYEIYEWMGGTSSSDFDFPAWASGNIVSDFPTQVGWLRKSVITQRAGFGSPLVTEDAGGRPHSIVYDRFGQYASANFLGADTHAGEAAYYGFEDYEEASGWNITTPAAIVTDQANTGQSSLRIPAGGQLTNSFSPKRTDRAYVLAWWYRTAGGYQPTAGTGWQIAMTKDGNPVSDANQSIPFADTLGDWKYASVRIDPPSGAQPGSVEINLSATNAGATDVYLDQVRFLPDVAQFTAHVYAPTYRLTTAEVGMGTSLSRRFYDVFHRETGRSGPFQDTATDYELAYFSRQAAGIFSTTTPNARLSLKPLSGGRFVTGYDAAGWQQNWKAVEPADWSATGGGLVHHSDTVAGALSLEHPAATGDYAISFGLDSATSGTPLALTDTVRIEINPTSHFTYDPASTNWQLVLAGQALSPLRQPARSPGSVLLVNTPETVLLYVDNELLLTQNPVSPVTGAPVLRIGKNKLALRQLAFFLRPALELHLEDGTEKLRQQHTLEGNNAVIGQVLYDERGNKIATTKNAPARFGSLGTGYPLFTYDADFVDTAAFRANSAGSGSMQGKVATYYNGQSGGSDDGGYPYSRNLLEASPLARVIESGLPGSDYAIINPGTSLPASRPTVKYAYGANDGTRHNLPAGNYYLQTRTDETGKQAYQLIDKLDQVLFREQDAVVSGTRVTYATDGKTVGKCLPNFFLPNGADKEAFVFSTHYDLLGKVVRTDHPDAGTVDTINNQNGHKRFVRDALGEQDTYFLYFRYDALGRVIERGRYNGNWDPVTLRRHATDPEWPCGDALQEVLHEVTYLNNGDGAAGTGKMHTAVTENPAAGITVSEAYTYDERAGLSSTATTLRQGSVTLEDTVTGYLRSLTGKITRVTYPTQAGSAAPIIYTYDRLDRLTGIGVENTPFRYGAFTHDAAGQLSQFSGNDRQLVTDYGYYPPGWIKTMAGTGGTAAFSQSVNERFADGRVKTVGDTVRAPGNDSDINYRIDFDGMDQLTSVHYDGHEDWSLSVGAYDPNGNVQQLTLGAETRNFDYVPGSNQLATVTTGTDERYRATYNAKGGAKTVTTPGRTLAFQYAPGSGLTTAIDLGTSGERLLFAYNHHGKRVAKLRETGGTVSSTKLYVHGDQALPLVEITDGVATQYVYGPQGLVALRQRGEDYFVTKDHLGSNRLLQDSCGNVIGAYSYQAYGAPALVSGSQPDLLPYRFTGQEWDAETALYNYRARLYDPSLGRFYGVDPKLQTASPYVYVNNDPFDLTDPTGESFLGDLFSWIGQIFIDVVEIVGAVVADVITLGVAEPFTAPILGAGISGAVYDIGAAATHKKPSWVGFGEAQAIGAVSGGLSAGAAALGDAAEAGINAGARAARVVASSGEESVDETSSLIATDTVKASLGRRAVAKATNFGIRGVGGAAAGSADKAIDNGFTGQSAGSGVGISALTGFLSAVIGTGFNQLGKGSLSLGATPSFGRRLITGAVSGAAGKVTGSVVTDAIQKKDFNGLDLGLDAVFGAVTVSIKTVGFLKDADKYKPTVFLTSYSNAGTRKEA